MLADGEQIEGDVVVVATGSQYSSPFKPQGESTREFAENVRAAHSNLMTANAVTIVGGGAVGVELAGEISSAYPSKAVVLVSATPSLMPGYSDKLGDALTAQLRSKGVSLRFNRRVENLAARDRPFAGSLDEDLGGAHEQLIFPALGARPTTAVFQQMPGATFDAQGRVEVDAWLRPAGAASIFALGDAAATGDPMTIVAITRQAPWLTSLLKAVLAGRTIESLAPYKPWPTRGILVPLGPRDGASSLPILRNGLLVGRWLTSQLKGRELFIPRYLKEFGYAAGFK
jgi:apoptosis-inducing factor 2